MSNELTYEEYKNLVETQISQILDTLALVATGNLEVEVSVPEGIDVITDMAHGFSFLLEDLRILWAEQNEAREELETRVTERTGELERTLTAAQTLQKRYISQEWEAYLQARNEEMQEEIDDQFVPTFTQALEQRTPVISETIKGDQTGFSLAIPVQYSDETIGILGFQGDELHGIDNADLAAVEEIVEQVGLALENQRLFDQTQSALSQTEKQAQRLIRLNEMGTELNAALTISDVYSVAVSFTQELIQADFVSITLLSDDFQEFTVSGMAGVQGVSHLGQRWGLDDTAIGEAVYQRQPLYHPDIQTTHFQDHQRLIKQGLKSTLIAPLVAQRVLGTLNMASTDKNKFSTQDQNLVRQIASLVAATIENRVLLDQTTQRAAQLEKLSQIESKLSAATDEHTIVDSVGEAFSDEFQTIRLYYIETDKYNNPLGQTCVASWEDGEIQPDSSFIGTANAFNRFGISNLWINNPTEPLFIEDVWQDDRLEDKTKASLSNRDIKALIAVPLRSAGDWQAVLICPWPEPQTISDTVRFVLDNIQDTLGAVVATRRAEQAQRIALNESIRRSRELDALNQVGRVVVQQLDPKQLADAIYDQIEQVIEYNIFFIGVYQADTQMFDTLLFSDKKERLYDLPNRKLTTKNGTYQSMYQRRTIIVQPTVEEFAEQPTPDPSQLIGNRTTLAPSRIYIPLMSGPDVIGSMSIHSNKFHAYTQNDINLLNGIATYFAVAWQNATLFNATKRRADRERLVYEITQKIQSTTSVEKALQATVQELGRALKSRYTQIALHIADEDASNSSVGAYQHD